MTMNALPTNDSEIERLLSTPTRGAVDTVSRLQGDFMVLGVGGKMGTSTALMLRRALDSAGRTDAVVTGVSRFSRASAREFLEQNGVRTLSCDLANDQDVKALPHAANVLYLAGQKFGTDSAPEQTWVQNVHVPALVAQRFSGSRLVVFSTGCVYPFMPIGGAGADESEPLAFIGEYASTCVGRERIFTHFAKQHGTQLLLYRLNYAVELRYGVLVDIASAVWSGAPIDVSMGAFNCIWQGDACARAIQCLEHAAHPPRALNITGPEQLRIRTVAETFGNLLGRNPKLVGSEAANAWLADASESIRLFGPPEMTVSRMMEMIANYLRDGGRLLGKPTHFDARDGKF